MEAIDQEGSPNFDNVKKMDYLHATLNESLRMYPPVPLDMRLCMSDDVLPSGHHIKANVRDEVVAPKHLTDPWVDVCCVPDMGHQPQSKDLGPTG